MSATRIESTEKDDKESCPFAELETCIKKEKALGNPGPQVAALSTVDSKSNPQSRVVAIREISPKGIIFFTQKGTKKTAEMAANPNVNLTFSLGLTQASVRLDAKAEALTSQENETYWQSYPRTAQIRFAAYAATSGQPISSKKILEDKRKAISELYKDNKPLPMDPHYCGYRLHASKFSFYFYRTDELSDVFEYHLKNEKWEKQIISP